MKPKRTLARDVILGTENFPQKKTPQVLCMFAYRFRERSCQTVVMLRDVSEVVSSKVGRGSRRNIIP